MLRCAFVLAAFLFTAAPAAASAGDPLHVVEAAPAAPPRDIFVIWLSGDGGWGKMEKQATARLAAAGIPTAGISTFRYYAHTRPPKEAAADVGALAQTMAKHFGRSRFVIVGFSFGAGVAPFVVDALAPETRSRLAFVTLLSPGVRANFKRGPRTWLNLEDGPEVAPELARMAPTPVLCIANAGVFKDVCPATDTATIHTVRLGGGHVLNNQYDAIVTAMVEEAAQTLH